MTYTDDLRTYKPAFTFISFITLSV